jgi:DNA polymerase-1
MKVVFDIECNALDNPTKIWCIVARDVDTNEEYVFLEPDYSRFVSEFVPKVQRWIGHNIINYDCKVLTTLLGLSFPHDKVTDTLVLSHLLKFKLEEGHSLEAWGDRLGIAKVGLDIDFSDQSSIHSIIERCKRDVEINLKLYKFLMNKLDRKEFKEAIETEMEFAWICREMHENGFAFDIDGAKQLYAEIDKEVQELDSQIKAAFPRKSRLIREITPKLTQYGTISRANLPRDWVDLTQLSAGSTFSLVKFDEFNPTSTKQIIERLSKYWDPVDRTDTYLKAQKAGDKEKLKKLEATAWKINETNLSTLSDDAPPAAKFLVRRLMLGSRLRTLAEWMSFYNPETGRVHGKFNGIGTAPHRMSHRNPNLGNVAAEKSIKYTSKELKEEATRLGGRMRSLWKADKGCYLVGCDMESAHLRIFAHLIDDDNFKEALLKGDKKNGTDPHSVNARILADLGADRDRAKTFIFSFLNGAGVAKVASIFGTALAKAKESLRVFIESYPGLKRFKEKDAKAWARRGYFQGPDGRYVVCESDHHMLAWYLQNYEAVIVKKTVLIALKKIRDAGISAKIVNVVHDEILIEVFGSEEDCKKVGEITKQTFREVGELYKIKIPIDGEYRIGRTWLEAH